MRLVMVLMFMFLVGCAGTFGARDNGRGALLHANRIGVGLAVGTIACDWGGTRWAAQRGWVDKVESNPILGPAPSTARVDAYMAASALVVVGLGQLLPSKLRPLLYAAAVVVEVEAIRHNLGTTPGVCGLSGGEVRSMDVVRK